MDKLQDVFCSERSLGTCSRWLVFSKFAFLSPWMRSHSSRDFTSHLPLRTNHYIFAIKWGLKYCEQPLFPAFSGHRSSSPPHLSPHGLEPGWAGTALNQAGVQCLAGQWNDNRQRIWISSSPCETEHPACLDCPLQRVMGKRN